MKHANRLVFILLPVTVLIFVLCACSGTKNTTPTSVSAYKSQGAYTDLGVDQLRQEALDALPKKYPNMPADEARQICVDFWHYCKGALWIPDAQYDIYKDEDGVNVYKRSVESGGIYGGLPYVSNATGNIYRLLDFMDPETGVVNVTEAGRYPKIFGGMCSSGCYWAWARVLNSADYSWTHEIVTRNGFIRVGPYTYDDQVYRFSNEYGTHNVMEENGKQIMYQSYAQLQLADGLGYSRAEGAGHIVMCTIAPHVEYNEDGTINGEKSYIHITDQGAIWEDGVSSTGLQYRYECSVDKKQTFAQLFKNCYVPFTFADLLGTDPIEETEVSFSHTGDTITKKELFSAVVTANYAISDIYVKVYDPQGNEVFKHAARAHMPSIMEMKIHKLVDKSYTWGSWDNVKTGYTVKVEVLLGTGEHPLLWEGKLAA